jgi:PAS domain S-box-containing protein
MSPAEKFDRDRGSEVFFDQSPDVLCLLGFDGRLKAVNPEWEATIGFSAQEVSGKPFLDLVHADDRKQNIFELNRLTGGEHAVLFENRFLCKDGSFRSLQWKARSDAGKDLIYCSARDISDLRQSESALRESEEKLRNIIENTVEGILQTTPDGQILMANASLLQMLGYGSSLELSTNEVSLAQIYVDPEDWEFSSEELTKHGALTLESQFRRKDGETIWVTIKSRVVRGLGGPVQYHEHFVEDITEHKLLEAAIRTSEEKYRTLVENAVYGIYRSSLDGRLLEVNHAFVAMLGYQSREEVLSLNMETDIYLHPGERAKMISQYRNVERVKGLVVDWKRKNGTPITVRLSGRKVRNSVGVLEGFEFIAEEVSVESRMQAAPLG